MKAQYSLILYLESLLEEATIKYNAEGRIGKYNAEGRMQNVELKTNKTKNKTIEY